MEYSGLLYKFKNYKINLKKCKRWDEIHIWTIGVTKNLFFWEGVVKQKNKKENTGSTQKKSIFGVLLLRNALN